MEENIKPIKSYIQLSESRFLKTKDELSLMTAKVLKANLEGVVLKDPTGTYQPGKRGWLKVKKDYLFGGRMADTADLVVLGASYGSGNKGGVLSIFLMGCFDPRDKLWKTVTKVHTGLDDKTRLKMHDHLMKLMDRSDGKQVPIWFLCNKPLIPDFIAKDPKAMPVWEITGAEFTKSGEHTASGISIRFPRITRLRDDKSAEHANDLPHLEQLFEASKNNINVDLLIKGCDDTNVDEDSLQINSKLDLQKTPKKDIKTEDDKSPIDSIKIKTETPISSSKKRKSEKDVETSESVTKNKKIKTESLDKKETKTKKQLTLLSAFKKSESLANAKQEVQIKKESNLFEDVVGYFGNIQNSNDIVQTFIANGGTVTTDSKKADINFYESYDVKIDLDSFREKYRKSSHHLCTQWLLDSIEKKTLLDYGLYAIVLKQ